MILALRARSTAAARPRRPAVVESGFPPPTSDGRALLAAGRAVPRAGRFVPRAHPPTLMTQIGRLCVANPPAILIQVGRFSAIGVVSTLAWAGLFSLLRGVGLGSVAANGVALLVTAIGNTAANRRFTFGRTGREGLARDHGAGIVAFVIALAITSAAAALLTAFAPHAVRIVEIAVLSVANVLATAARFALLRAWVGRPATAPPS
jgi:putative flippase GtrA